MAVRKGPIKDKDSTNKDTLKDLSKLPQNLYEDIEADEELDELVEDKPILEEATIKEYDESSFNENNVEEKVRNDSMDPEAPISYDKDSSTDKKDNTRFDKVSRTTHFGNSFVGKLLKGLKTFLTFIPAMIVEAAVRILTKVALPKNIRDEVYKKREQKIINDANLSKMETPNVANTKMKILNDLSIEDGEKLKQLSTLCYTTGCDFSVVMNDGAALKFCRNEKYVEILYSDPPKLRKGDKVESYLFGNPIGNVRYPYIGFSSKPKDININTVLDKLDEHKGFNVNVDTLKDGTHEYELNTFMGRKDNTEVSLEEGIKDNSIKTFSEGDIEYENPGHEDVKKYYHKDIDGSHEYLVYLADKYALSRFPEANLEIGQLVVSDVHFYEKDGEIIKDDIKVMPFDNMLEVDAYLDEKKAIFDTSYSRDIIDEVEQNDDGRSLMPTFYDAEIREVLIPDERDTILAELRAGTYLVTDLTEAVFADFVRLSVDKDRKDLVDYAVKDSDFSFIVSVKEEIVETIEDSKEVAVPSKAHDQVIEKTKENLHETAEQEISKGKSSQKANKKGKEKDEVELAG